MTLSEQVCGALRYTAEEITLDASQHMAAGRRLAAVADAIEADVDVREQLAEAERWMAEPTSFDLIAVLRLLEPVVDSDASLIEWAYSVRREAETTNKSEHGWG